MGPLFSQNPKFVVILPRLAAKGMGNIALLKATDLMGSDYTQTGMKQGNAFLTPGTEVQRRQKLPRVGI